MDKKIDNTNTESTDKKLIISDVSKRYIAKKDAWFKENTECEFLEDYKEGGGFVMNEVCSHDEFNVF